jgi:hypothetical protein
MVLTSCSKTDTTPRRKRMMHEHELEVFVRQYIREVKHGWWVRGSSRDREEEGERNLILRILDKLPKDDRHESLLPLVRRDPELIQRCYEAERGQMRKELRQTNVVIDEPDENHFYWPSESSGILDLIWHKASLNPGEREWVRWRINQGQGRDGVLARMMGITVEKLHNTFARTAKDKIKSIGPLIRELLEDHGRPRPPTKTGRIWKSTVNRSLRLRGGKPRSLRVRRGLPG